MDGRKFRFAMGNFSTGVTVITTELDGEVSGMTANAFMSLSMDPELVVISIDEKAQMLEKIKRSGKYAVNILSAEQQDLSMNFAGQSKLDKDIPFQKLSGVPVIEGSLAQVSCEVTGSHVEGDHTLFIGRVNDIHLEDNEPLVFFKGKYRSLSPIEEMASG
ncbi:flavin reductase family protein [Salicibibacter kimchii]|uniref:Flavin reductase n=1 Tax=Salicibibacter kimchii TaxID=2099786 RepID=A0A345C0N5_9BACI|nr:flavin reductase family protein [Salicibibacter kimchii]AXF56766.1 flavin reductase [Salicibibacter kimchii]